MSTEYPEIQPRDDAPTEVAVSGKLRKQIQEHRREQQLEAESHVRQLITLADDALTGQAEGVLPEEVLQELHYALRVDSDLPEVLTPGGDVEAEVSQTHKMRFVMHCRMRDKGQHPPCVQEYGTAVEIAEALGYFGSYHDRTRYAPVRLSPLSSSEPDTVQETTQIARRRVGASDAAELEQRAVNIDHSSCEHFLTVALPRQGKDSTACRLIGNLVNEHGYKAFSIFDDGRNETNMWAIPNDEEKIREIQARDFGQEPRGYPTKMFIPAAGDIPDELPENFQPFTIGVDDLTPEIVKRLASVSASNADTERRLGMAIKETVQQEGTVEALIQRIHDYADETEASISVTEVLDDEQRGERSTSTETVSYTMDEDKYLREIAKSLTMLAGDGLLGDRGQDTNLDMVEEFQHQERVAVLNCNYLEPHNAYLKYVLANVWVNLIYELRDDDTLRLPRAVLELRELKNLAPSVKSRARYSGIVSSLTQTLYEIATQGGSRRVLMVGSTQKLNGVNKAIRQNMPNKILLKCGEEEVKTLDKALSFSPKEEHQLKTFNKGWGMLIYNGEKKYPIQFCPALNGLGLGDYNWKDRYGQAMGARVPAFAPYPDDADGWIDMDGDLHQEAAPEEGDWYLLPEDLPEDARPDPGEAVPEEQLEAALQERREYELPQSLHMEPTNYSNTQREVTLVRAEHAEERQKEKLQQEYDIPPVLGHWLEYGEEKRQRLLDCCRAISGHEIEKQDDLGDMVGVSGTTISNYCNSDKELRACVDGTGRGETMELTPIGERALQLPWSKMELPDD